MLEERPNPVVDADSSPEMLVSSLSTLTPPQSPVQKCLGKQSASPLQLWARKQSNILWDRHGPLFRLAANPHTLKYSLDRNEQVESGASNENTSPLRITLLYSVNACCSRSNSSLTSDVRQSISSISSTDDSDMSDMWQEPIAGTSAHPKPQPDNELDPARLHKFIPVPNPVPLQLPKLLVNLKDMKEWKEAQKAFEIDVAQNIQRSQSEPQISHSLSFQAKPKTHKPKVKKLSWKFWKPNLFKVRKHRKGKKQSQKNKGAKVIKHGDHGKQISCSKLSENDTPLRNLQMSVHDGRFQEEVNALFCHLNIKPSPNFSAILYVEKPEDPNPDLCHIKTELVVSAMLNYFYPYKDVQCIWVKAIQEEVTRLLKDKTLSPKFTKLVYLRMFSAVLVLSFDAAGLLRHRDTCFMYSLATALQVRPSKILVLAKQE